MSDYAEMTRNLIREIHEEGHPTTGYFAGQQVLLLTTTGAKSGEERTHPVAYTRDGDDIIEGASKGGAPTNPAWFANLTADPDIKVELDRKVIPVHARVAEGAERQRLWEGHAAVHPQFNEYPSKTDRV